MSRRAGLLRKPLTLLFASGMTLVALVAFAANVHFKGGANSEPTFLDRGTVLNVSACLAGLGNQDVTITVTAKGIGKTTCTNPGGKTSPGINKKLTNLSATQTISATEIKNGQVCFSLDTKEPGPISAKEAGCPNNNWAAFTDVDFTSAEIVVKQGGKTVLSQSFSL
ncbi:MAG: hypothetical protein KY468_09585 [Armatimonadetes bacterium]|nr:hypothetical protein [Armatimonadota bacterium]